MNENEKNLGLNCNLEGNEMKEFEVENKNDNIEIETVQPTIADTPEEKNVYTRPAENNIDDTFFNIDSAENTEPAPAPKKVNPYTIEDFQTPSQKAKKSNGKKWAVSVAAICAALVISGGSFYAGAVYNSGKVETSSVSTNAPTTNTSSQAIANGTSINLTQDNTKISSTITDVVEQAMPSMVSINVVSEQKISNNYGSFFEYFYGESYPQTYEVSSSGSGIIIAQNDTQLLVVTNNHVVSGATKIAVQFIDGESCDAVIKGTSADNDLAVVSVDIANISADTLSKIKVAVLGNSDDLKLGESAIAIGNSLGFGQSVTVGYISALNREVQISDRTMTLIQTDAAINPGNSGGALLNIKGEVIGINSAKYSDTSVEGTGYAIPISKAEPIIEELMSDDYISDDQKAYLGIYGQSVPDSYQERFGWPKGVYVSRIVSDSPALMAGVQAGDIITAIDGEECDSMESLQAILEKHKSGDKVKISVTRSDTRGDLHEIEITATLMSKGDFATDDNN